MQKGELLDYVFAFAITAVVQEGFDVRFLHGQLATILMRQIYSCPHAHSQNVVLGKRTSPLTSSLFHFWFGRRRRDLTKEGEKKSPYIKKGDKSV